jgi:hypothetical protein
MFKDRENGEAQKSHPSLGVTDSHTNDGFTELNEELLILGGEEAHPSTAKQLELAAFEAKHRGVKIHFSLTGKGYILITACFDQNSQSAAKKPGLDLSKQNNMESKPSKAKES